MDESAESGAWQEQGLGADAGISSPPTQQPVAQPLSQAELSRKVNPPVPERFAWRTSLAWVVVVVFVMFLIGLQAMGRYAGTPEEVAPGRPSDIGAMQIQISGRHGVGMQVLGRYLPGVGDAVERSLIGQLEEVAAENPVQLVRAAGYALFLRGGLPGDAVGMLEKAQQFIDSVDSEHQVGWIDNGYVEDIAAFKAVAEGGAQAIGDDERARIVERYGDFARAALTARLDESEPERQAFVAKGVRTSVALLSALGLVVIAAITGIVLLIVGVVLIAHGKVKPGFIASLAPAETEGAPEPPAALTLETFAGFLIVFVGVQMIVGLAIGWVVKALGISGAADTLLMLPFLWMILLMALWPVWMGASGRWNRRALGWHTGKGVLREIGAGIVGYLAGLPIVGLGLLCTFLLMILMGMLGFDASGSHPAPDMIVGGGVAAVAGLLMLGVVWAPVVEETFFRGALQHHLRRSHGFVVSGLATAFVFAAIHPQGIVGVPVLMSIGFVFSMIREWRGSIIGCMVAHAINNGFVFSMLIVALV